MDDLPELSSCADSNCGTGSALKLWVLLFWKLSSPVYISPGCSHWQRQGLLRQGGDIRQTGFQHAGKKWTRREQFRAAFLLAYLTSFWYLFQGEKPAWFSVLASNLLPVHVTMLSNADAVYEKHTAQEFLKVRGGAGGSSWLQVGRPPVWGTSGREHPQVSEVWDFCSG